MVHARRGRTRARAKRRTHKHTSNSKIDDQDLNIFTALCSHAANEAPWLETAQTRTARAHQPSGKAQSDGNVALAIHSRATPAVAEWVPAASRYRVVLQWRLDNCCGGEEGTAEASLNCKSPADRRRRRRH